MGFVVLDVALGIDDEAFGFEAGALELVESVVHFGTEPGVCADDTMPWKLGRFLWRESGHDEGNVPSHDVHVHGDAAIGGELPCGDECHQTDHLRADAGESWGLGLGQKRKNLVMRRRVSCLLTWSAGDAFPEEVQLTGDDAHEVGGGHGEAAAFRFMNQLPRGVEGG